MRINLIILVLVITFYLASCSKKSSVEGNSEPQGNSSIEACIPSLDYGLVACTPENNDHVTSAKKQKMCKSDGSDFTFGLCEIESCAEGYVINDRACVAQTISSFVCSASGDYGFVTCTPTNNANVLSAHQSKTCNEYGTGFIYGDCSIIICDPDYIINNNSCVPVPTIPPTVCIPSADYGLVSCIPDNNEHVASAKQEKICKADGSGYIYGTCNIETCAEGYIIVNNSCQLPPLPIPPANILGNWTESNNTYLLEVKNDWSATFTGTNTLTPFVANCTFTSEDSTITYHCSQVGNQNVTFKETCIISLLGVTLRQTCAWVDNTSASGSETYYKIIPPKVISADGGAWHSLALKSDGKVYAFGRNTYGELGDGTNTDKYTPVVVMTAAGIPLTNIIKISAGGYHSLALKSDGTVWAFGLNDAGQLGDGTIINKSYATEVMEFEGIPLTNVKEISAGLKHSIVLKNDGTVFSFGSNINGQLGDGTVINKSFPIQVTQLSNIQKISAGHFYSMAIKNDGTVYGFGANSYGQLGDGTNIEKHLPVEVLKAPGVALTDIIKISTGALHSMALTSDGKVFTFGINIGGQLGDGTTNNHAFALEVSGLINIVEIANGSQYSLVLKNDGTVFSFGNNNWGQLGIGTLTSSYTPVQVMESEGVPLSQVEHISCGAFSSLITKLNGTLLSFGLNFNFGELGDGTKINRSYPVTIIGN